MISVFYKNKIDKLNTSLKEMNLKNFEDFLITILVIHFLFAIHQNKKDEYKLIVNKSIKYLQNNKIKYEDIAKLI